MRAFCVPRQIIHCHFPSLLEQHAFFYVFFLLVRTVELQDISGPRHLKHI
jgi:hypothetical protein